MGERLTEKEKDILPELIRAITLVPDETKHYLLGYAQCQIDNLRKDENAGK